MAQSALKLVTFKPDTTVDFLPTKDKQSHDLLIHNQSTETVAFKMKSTRPRLYKMAPVYGMLIPGEKTTIKLKFQGLLASMKCPKKDRFSCTLIIAPPNTTNVKEVWRERRSFEAPASADIRNKSIAVIFPGINDTAYSLAKRMAEDNSGNTTDLMPDRIIGVSQPTSFKKTDTTITKPTPQEVSVEPKKPPKESIKNMLFLMFRSKPAEDDSKSDDDEDGGTDTDNSKSTTGL